MGVMNVSHNGGHFPEGLEMDTDFLFARPSFLEGFARVVDLGGTLNTYNTSPSAAEADAAAIWADVRAVAGDIRAVGNRLKKRTRRMRMLRHGQGAPQET